MPKDATPSPEEELDRLYAGPPGEFVAGRDDLAKRLKAGGDDEGATRARKLRRPSQAASLVNWLSCERSEELNRLTETLASMRGSAAGAEGGKLRAAVRAERESVAALLAAAEEEADRRGITGPATVDRVGETLRAIATDPDLERAVLAGRLEKEGEASTLGFELSTSRSRGTPRASRPKAKPDPDPKAERAALGKSERQARAAEEAVEEAAANVERAEEGLRSAREALREAKAGAKSARGEAARRRRRVSKL